MTALRDFAVRWMGTRQGRIWHVLVCLLTVTTRPTVVASVPTSFSQDDPTSNPPPHPGKIKPMTFPTIQQQIVPPARTPSCPTSSPVEKDASHSETASPTQSANLFPDSLVDTRQTSMPSEKLNFEPTMPTTQGLLTTGAPTVKPTVTEATNRVPSHPSPSPIVYMPSAAGIGAPPEDATFSPSVPASDTLAPTEIEMTSMTHTPHTVSPENETTKTPTTVEAIHSKDNPTTPPTSDTFLSDQTNPQVTHVPFLAVPTAVPSSWSSSFYPTSLTGSRTTTDNNNNHDLSMEEMIPHKCGGLLAEDRTVQIIRLIKDYSGPNSLESARTAQFRAYMWMNHFDPRVLCPLANPALFLQRYTLVLFYFYLSGQAWDTCTAMPSDSTCATEEARWLSMASECEWFGITCSPEGLVTHIDLPNHGLGGSLPKELFNLIHLQGIRLGHNGSIRGQIPTEIAKLTALQYLDLDDNQLQGPFPNVYDISTLQAIDINNNNLTGTVDGTRLAQLSSLVVLQIENNKFHGPLPLDAIQQLPQLVLFSSQGNAFQVEALAWQSLCDAIPAQRSQSTIGYLQFLLADCGETMESACPCCSVCF